MNLQQACNIVNYDLPWNPMRLVQRHGRIDRIGSRHPEVFLRCVFPDSRLDDLLGLEERRHLGGRPVRRGIPPRAAPSTGGPGTRRPDLLAAVGLGVGPGRRSGRRAHGPCVLRPNRRSPLTGVPLRRERGRRRHLRRHAGLPSPCAPTRRLRHPASAERGHHRGRLRRLEDRPRRHRPEMERDGRPRKPPVARGTASRPSRCPRSLPTTSTASPGSRSPEALHRCSAAMQVVGVATAGEPVDFVCQRRVRIEISVGCDELGGRVARRLHPVEIADQRCQLQVAAP